MTYFRYPGIIFILLMLIFPNTLLAQSVVDEADDSNIATIVLNTSPQFITGNVLTTATRSTQVIGSQTNGLEPPPADMKDVWVKIVMPPGRHHLQIDFYWIELFADGFSMLYREAPGGGLGEIVAKRRPHLDDDELRTGVASCCYVSNEGETLFARFGSTNNTAPGQYCRIQCLDTDEKEGAVDLPNNTVLFSDYAKLATHSPGSAGTNPDVWFRVDVAANSLYRVEMLNDAAIHSMTLYRNTSPLQQIDQATVNLQSIVQVAGGTGNTPETFLLRLEFSSASTGESPWMYSRFAARLRNDEPRVDPGHPFRLAPGQIVGNIRFDRALPSAYLWPHDLGYFKAPFFQSYHNYDSLLTPMPNPSAWYYVDLYKNTSMKASFAWPPALTGAGYAMALYVDTATPSASATPPNPAILIKKGYARQTKKKTVKLGYKYKSKLATDLDFQRVWIRVIPDDPAAFDYITDTPAGTNLLSVTYKLPPVGINPPE